MDVWLLHVINGLAARNAGLDALMVAVARYAPVVFGLGLIVQWFLPDESAGVRLARLWALGSWGLAALLAFSRVFAGTHYPSDVLAGTVLGLTVSWALYRARGALFPRIDRLLALVDTAPLPGKTFAAQQHAPLVNRRPQPKRG